MKLLVCRGYSSSGKTTYAKNWIDSDPDNRLRVNRDDLRESLFNQEGVLSQDKEGIITSVQRSVAKKALQQGKDVICDDTNLVRKFAVEWANLAQELGAEFEVIDFKTPLEECLRRNLERASVYGGRFVPEDAIRKQASRFPFKQWGSIVAKEGVLDLSIDPYTPVDGVPVYIVDIDGTVATTGGLRSHYDYTTVSGDLPRKDIIRVVEILNKDADIIFFSGRKAMCYDDTLAWLKSHLNLDHYALYMRATDDNRPDFIIKYELFNEHARHKNVVGAVDDRRQVVDLWRKLGLTVFDVGDGTVF